MVKLSYLANYWVGISVIMDDSFVSLSINTDLVNKGYAGTSMLEYLNAAIDTAVLTSTLLSTDLNNVN